MAGQRLPSPPPSSYHSKILPPEIASDVEAQPIAMEALPVRNRARNRAIDIEEGPLIEHMGNRRECFFWLTQADRAVRNMVIFVSNLHLNPSGQVTTWGPQSQTYGR